MDVITDRDDGARGDGGDSVATGRAAAAKRQQVLHCLQLYNLRFLPFARVTEKKLLIGLELLSLLASILT